MDSKIDNSRYLARHLIQVSGADRLSLLQKLVSQDLAPLGPDMPALYTLLLTPQGKYLFDFFVIYTPHHLYLDAPATQSEALVTALTKYKLRSDITFKPMPAMHVQLSHDAGEGLLCVKDPRAAQLGYRIWAESPGAPFSWAAPDYGQRLTEAGIIEPSLEMISGTSMPVEFGLHHMHAISFTKGCYLGQELTARMQHKDLARRMLIVAKGQDYQSLEGSFAASVKDTNGVEIGTVIRMASPFALLHVQREHAGTNDVQTVFNVQRLNESQPIQLARY